MRSQWKVLLSTLALGPLFVWGPQLPELLSEMETFRISEVQVRGTRFLTEDSVVSHLRLEPTASAWGDTRAWEDRLSTHPLIQSAEIRRRLPNGLRVTIREREPVALAATPVLEPIDAEGRRLPIDPTRYRLDLPVIMDAAPPAEGATVFPEDVRALASELERLAATDAEFTRRISTLRLADDGSLITTLLGPEVDFVLPPGVTAERLEEGESALAHALQHDPRRVPTVVDLRFADQVVVRRNRDD